MSEFLRLVGQLAKAFTDEAGRPHLQVLASGPELDRTGERLSKAAREKFAALAKAGSLPLVPSHDVPIPLANSVGGEVTLDGHLVVDYLIDPADPMAMRLHKAVESGAWKGQVSVGSPTCTKGPVFDDLLKKTVTEVADFDEVGAHIATTFPGRAAYPHAAVSALYKAVRPEHDVAELAARGWPEDVLAKAVESGVWTPPTFGERLASRKLQDELPEMLEVLRYTVEDLVNPWSVSDAPEERRAKLRQSFAEFEAAVFGAIADAQTTPIEKSIPAGEPTPPAAPEPPPQPTAAELIAAAVAPLTKALDEAKGEIEALRKSIAERATPPATPAPAPASPGRTTTVFAHTGRSAESDLPAAAELRKSLEDERDQLTAELAKLDRRSQAREYTRIAERLNLLHVRISHS